jgi:hypothetical protein
MAIMEWGMQQSLPRFVLRGFALRIPDSLLRQLELPFSRGGVTKLASVRDSDVRSAQGPNSLLNFTEFVLKYRCALMQSFYDVQDRSLQVYEMSDH